MYYFYYFIRIFREIFGRRALKKIVFILAIVIVIFFLLRINGYCSTDVIDINQSIYSRYESVASDFLNRINFYQSSSSIGIDTKTEIINKLKDGNYNYYIYYDNLNGSSMLDGTSFNSYSLNIAFFDTQNTSVVQSVYEKYYNYTTNIVRTNNTYVIYTLANGNITVSSFSDYIHFPTLLYTYKPQVITNFLNTNDTDRIVGAIEEGNAINQATQDFMTDDSITNSNMNIDTTDMTISDTNGVDNFINNLLGSFKTFFENIGDEVEYISIPIPHNGGTIELPSNLLSKYVSNTWFEPMISTLWYFAFGTYLLFYIRFMIKFWSSGEFSNSGLAYFIEHLENNDPFINASMM